MIKTSFFVVLFVTASVFAPCAYATSDPHTSADEENTSTTAQSTTPEPEDWSLHAQSTGIYQG